MKVCMMTTSFPRSLEDVSSVFIYRLCRTLVSHKTEVDVVAPADYEDVFSEEMEGIKVHRFSYFFPARWQKLAYGEGGGIPANLNRCPWLILQAPFFMFMFFIKTLRVSRGADVLHANWIFVGMIAWAVQIFRGIPFIVTLRGSDVQRAQKGKISYLISLWILKRAAVITTVNLYLREWVIEQGIPAERVRFIRNGVQSVPMPSAKKAETSCRLLFVGSLIPRKSVDTLIRAVSQTHIAELDYSLTIVGDGAEADSLKRQVDQFNLNDKVRFTGMLPPDQTFQEMAQSDCLVLPSLWEGTPNVVLEAMACGLSVVASDLPGIRELITPESNGLLFQARNVDDLSKALSRIISDQHLRTKLGENARKLILEMNMSWDQTALQYQECYQKICAESQDIIT